MKVMQTLILFIDWMTPNLFLFSYLHPVAMPWISLRFHHFMLEIGGL